MKDGGADLTELDHSEIFFNREFSWLSFNSRVLEESADESLPILERIKFLSIFFANLDEFFMVRVAGIKKAIDEDFKTTDSPDDLPPSEVLEGVYKKVESNVKRAYNICFEKILPTLSSSNVHLRNYRDLPKNKKANLTNYFLENIFPILTPLAVDPSHPFPFLANRRLYLLVSFHIEDDDQDHPAIAFVEIPEVVPRLVKVASPEDHQTFEYVLMEDLISHNIQSLFLGHAPKDICLIRVTRDLDFSLLENEVEDLLKSVQKEVRDREQASAVRLEVSDNTPPQMIRFIKKRLGLQSRDTYLIPGPLDLTNLRILYSLPLPHLKVTPFNPRLPPQFKNQRSIFSMIREKDLLLHHPYDSFYAVIDFINASADDDQVLSIKQTLYRTTGDSPLIAALIRAAEKGKQVTAVVELKARFDEKNNIIWARQMENAGVNVVFGFVGLKTHGKTTLVIRQEHDSLRRYVHLSTGNYNSSTAKSYVDLGLLTSDQNIGEDISTLFNLLTGFNIFSDTNRYGWQTPDFNAIIVAPLSLRQKFLELIEGEISSVKKGHKGRIMAKMNALVDLQLIQALYKASQQGVEITLIIRGICCLKPGVAGLSENIKVISIIDRFLEHSRIYIFEQKGKQATYLSSADWMPRNMDRRVEILFPILDEDLKDRIKNIIGIYLKDKCKASLLQPTGDYQAIEGKSKDRAQSTFIEIARLSGIKSIPYDKAIRHRRQKSGSRPIFIRPSQPKLPHRNPKKSVKP